MEMVDIIDEHNAVLYQASKDEAHAKGLLHRCVIAEVRNARGEWLMVRQAGHKQDAGQYVSPVGGHVQAGEEIEDALKREAEEEVGLTGFTFHHVGNAIYNREVIGRKENHLFIVYEIVSAQEPRINDESVAYRWFTEEELIREYRDHPNHFGGAFHFVVAHFYKEKFFKAL